MKTVLLFGAGASKRAGYPLTAELLTAVEMWATTTTQRGPGEEWSEWIAFRDSPENGLVRPLLNAPNPEIALSVLDLIEGADTDYLRARLRAAKNTDNANQADRKKNRETYEAIKAKSNLLDEGRVSRAAKARNSLLRCIEHFMILMGYEEVGCRDSRDYLKNLFERLQPGDVLISFNWDFASEQTLGEMGRWNPTTGYGFEKRLSRGSNSLGRVERMIIPSAITVLKPHGSIGWRTPWNQPSPVFFDDAYFLNHLRVRIEDEDNVAFFDPEFHRLSHENSMLVAPTFLKQIPAAVETQQIWYTAASALARADRVEIYGYSLPLSDAAARLLLNPLRFRLSERSVEVVVTDPSPETRENWDEFMGAKVSRDGTL